LTSFPLRLGLPDAFRPQTGVARGEPPALRRRLAQEKGVFRGPEAAARSEDRGRCGWIGSGPAVAPPPLGSQLLPAMRELGYDEDADRIAEAMADAVRRDGLREYYDPVTGLG
jgi:hypothetical protein